MTKIKFVFLGLFLLSTVLQAQVSLSGQVVNAQKKAVPYANVLLKKGDSIITYGTTDGKGKFRLNSIQPGTYKLSISALGYAEFTKILQLEQKRDYHLGSLVLKKEVVQLDDVFLITDRPVEIRGDTIIFNMEYFRDSTEQNVEDLLRKVPGLNIDRSGTIRVGGREIEKIMVEGDDFFGKGYKILSKNMPAYPISKVQILKDYTENRLLDALGRSGKVAINLKLKDEYKRQWFGNIKGGVGNRGFYKLKANLMNFGSESKYYFLTNLNNIGENATGELSALINDQNVGIGSNAQAAQFLSLPGHGLYLRRSRSNFNKARLISLNAIFHPTDSLEIKPLVLLNWDRNPFFRRTITRVNAPGTNFSNTENYKLRKKKRIAFGQLELHYDISENQLIHAVAQYNNGKFNNGARLIFNNKRIVENLPRDRRTFDQSISYTNRLDDKKVLSISARYIDEKNSGEYSINRFFYEDLFPAFAEADSVRQTVESEMQFAGIKANYSHRTENGNRLKLKLGYTFRKDKIRSRFSLWNEESRLARPEGYQNQLTYRKNDFFLGGNYRINWNGWTLSGSLTFHQFANMLTTEEAQKKQTPFLVNPKIRLSWTINKESNLSASYSYNISTTGVRDIYSNYILTGYRSFSKGTGDFSQLHASKWFLNYQLGNWSDRFFANFSGFYRKDYDFYSTSRLISQNFSRLKKIIVHDREAFGMNANANYYLSNLSSNVRGKLSYFRSDFKNRVNQSELRKITTENFTYGLKWTSAFDGSFDFTLGTEWQTSRIVTSDESAFTNNNTYLILSFIVSSRFNMELTGARYHLGHLTKNKNYHFLDFSANYALLKDKLTLGLRAKNLLNTETFTRYSISDIGSSVTKYRLLPRMLLVQAEFRF